jgi:hypothetical protein
MNTLNRLNQVLKSASILYGMVEQAPTPSDVIDSMYNEVPNDILVNNIIRDDVAGRGSIVGEGIKRKFMAKMTGNDQMDQKILEDIVSNEIYANDIDPAFADMARSTLLRITQNKVPVNVDICDAILYNITMNKTNVISITNPPYQPPRGVKKGGNEYKKHVIKSIKDCPTFGVANIPMTFMVQDPYDKENNDFKKLLVDSGLKKIKHVRHDAYKANVLTVYVVWEQGYTGEVEFSTYDVADVNKYHSIRVNRDVLRDLSIWPVARTNTEFDLSGSILAHAKKKYSFILNKADQKRDWCVEIEYMIGLEKERLNKVNPLRLAKRGPTDVVRGGSYSKFINVDDEAQADSLVEHLNTVGQTWFRMIPRGSSAENWMIGPVVDMWRDINIKSNLFD